MKLIDVVNAQSAMQTLAGTKLPVKASFRVAKALKLIAVDMMVYDENRIKLLEEFGRKAAEGNKYEFESPEKEQAFQKGFQELQQEEVVLAVEPLGIDDLGDCSLSPGDLFPLIGILIKE